MWMGWFPSCSGNCLSGGVRRRRRSLGTVCRRCGDTWWACPLTQPAEERQSVQSAPPLTQGGTERGRQRRGGFSWGDGNRIILIWMGCLAARSKKKKKTLIWAGFGTEILNILVLHILAICCGWWALYFCLVKCDANRNYGASCLFTQTCMTKTCSPAVSHLSELTWFFSLAFLIIVIESLATYFWYSNKMLPLCTSKTHTHTHKCIVLNCDGLWGGNWLKANGAAVPEAEAVAPRRSAGAAGDVIIV